VIICSSVVLSMSMGQAVLGTDSTGLFDVWEKYIFWQCLICSVWLVQAEFPLHISISVALLKYALCRLCSFCCSHCPSRCLSTPLDVVKILKRVRRQVFHASLPGLLCRGQVFVDSDDFGWFGSSQQSRIFVPVAFAISEIVSTCKKSIHRCRSIRSL
jgi:Pyruvate/2-oxoacid:ferredoxin oxidoreductase delta subunit